MGRIISNLRKLTIPQTKVISPFFIGCYPVGKNNPLILYENDCLALNTNRHNRWRPVVWITNKNP